MDTSKIHCKGEHSMKTKLILSIILMSPVVYFVFNGHSAANEVSSPTIQVYTDKISENKNTLQLAANDTGTKTSVIASPNSSKALIVELDYYAKITNCLNPEHNYCNHFNEDFRENNLFIKNKTHMHQQISNFLLNLKDLSEQDLEFFGLIPVEKLISFLKLTDDKSPVLALEILLEKTLSLDQQNKIIEEVISNNSDNQWQLYTLLLIMGNLTPMQTDEIFNSLEYKILNTKFKYSDMQLISNLNRLLLSPQQHHQLLSALCTRAEELNLSYDFKKRIYNATKVRCD